MYMQYDSSCGGRCRGRRIRYSRGARARRRYPEDSDRDSREQDKSKPRRESQKGAQDKDLRQDSLPRRAHDGRDEYGGSYAGEHGRHRATRPLLFQLPAAVLLFGDSSFRSFFGMRVRRLAHLARTSRVRAADTAFYNRGQQVRKEDFR